MKPMRSETTIDRRTFIRKSCGLIIAASIGPSIIPATVFGKWARSAPSERVTVGCIGTGPQGRGVMSNFLVQPDVQVLAVCDVAGRNLEAARNQVNQHYKNVDCKTYLDFRELINRPDIDALLIATPDHWHVPVAIRAAEAKKDMYLEKPMGLSIKEDQTLRRKIQKKKCIFQFGTQQRSSEQFRLACELVRNRRIGKLKKIYVWCSASRPGGSTKPTKVPDDLNYDMWLGPAPFSPYTDGKAFDNDPPGSWKTWWFNYDYALGFIAGWGVHPLDIAYWGFPEMMAAPFEIVGKGIFPTEGACNTAIAWLVRFNFANGVELEYRGVRNGYDVVNELNDLSGWQKKFGRAIDHGTAFEGTDGWVLVDRGAIRTSPEDLIETKFSAGEIRLPQSSNHVRNFIDSVKSRKPAICPIEDAVQADILCHLSDISTRLNRKLVWDPKKEKFIKDNDANRKLEPRPAREQWKI